MDQWGLPQDLPEPSLSQRPSREPWLRRLYGYTWGQLEDQKSERSRNKHGPLTNCPGPQGRGLWPLDKWECTDPSTGPPKTIRKQIIH